MTGEPMTWAEWVDAVHQDGGVATVVPSNVPDAFRAWVGYPAARYTTALYTALVNAGQIDPRAPQVAANSNAVVYVVAPPETWNTAPHTMTTSERMANAFYTQLDAGATALGLPTLAGVETFLKDAGKQIVIGVLVTIAITRILRRRT